MKQLGFFLFVSCLSFYCNWNAHRLSSRALLTRKSVLRQWVQTAGRHPRLVFSVCWEASQSVLRLGGGLIPPAQRWVRLQRGHLVDGGAEEGSGKLRGRGWKARRIRGPETHRCVGEIGGYSTLDWILVGGKWKICLSIIQSALTLLLTLFLLPVEGVTPRWLSVWLQVKLVALSKCFPSLKMIEHHLIHVYSYKLTATCSHHFYQQCWLCKASWKIKSNQTHICSHELDQSWQLSS